ncbi:Uma2 family endonuclease [Methylosinus sp. Sm6]|uniref:Uma2 family endonuclease n=1 Tax=Methylosinus sp. Sm6 TaxID=2866948 RepID=UPI001C99D672|nr:Uma2 family endonuclease [Methylosinus sp. Sm6]MBY6241022.1 Uma2 family endonuclease [Methylosinus sp. Sm6]
MSAPAIKRITIPDFLAWSEGQEKGRYELVSGEIVAMAPERAEHGRAKAQIWRALADALARSGASCEAFVDSVGVAIDAQTVYEPDVLVNCGEPIAPDAMLAPAPVVIVEVLSPSSRHIDKSVKLAGYFRLAGLAHYLVVDLDRRTVLHYRRQGADEPILLRIVTEGVIRLDPPGLDLALSEIFP